jgi:tetratricopeptide (TPR) repeat protein
MPALFYNRGLILMERNDLNGAKKEFLAGVNEASREGFAQVRNELSVYCYTNLGIIAWKQINYEESLKWFRHAEQQQNNAGANWVPTLSQTCKQLEGIIASQKKPG